MLIEGGDMVYKILIVDDEPPIRDLFDDLLKKEKCITKTASSGEEALEIIAKEDFDAILLDIKLSGMSGIDTLKRIREIKPKLIVVMITGFGYDEDLITKCRSLGCSGYIGKNMPISQIMNSLRLFIKISQEKEVKPA